MRYQSHTKGFVPNWSHETALSDAFFAGIPLSVIYGGSVNSTTYNEQNLPLTFRSNMRYQSMGR